MQADDHSQDMPGSEDTPDQRGDPHEIALWSGESDGKTSPCLEALRERIDELDRALIRIISERAQVVVDIGRAKQDADIPTYAPHRERQVLERVLSQNPGPLDNRTIEAIYRELMSGSFSLELPLTVGYLGPPGSFSHVAAVRHFGSSVDIVDLHDIDHVFEEVAAGRCRYGVVPYENSIGGGITDTLDAFQHFDVTVYAESLIDVSHTLLANCPQQVISVIYSKPQVFSQCRRWLAKHFPGVEQVPMVSSSAAVRRAAETQGAAAIGSELAGEIYNVKPLMRHIEDKANNVTRFLIIGRDQAKPSGDDITSILFVTSHKPGALVDVLAVFRDAGINLSHIEKRPSGVENWEYAFFIDCDAHMDDPEMKTAVANARAHCLLLKVLGSYPRARQTL